MLNSSRLTRALIAHWAPETALIFVDLGRTVPPPSDAPKNELAPTKYHFGGDQALKSYLKPVGNLIVDPGYALDSVGENSNGLGRMKAIL
jgi:hypothetical protein